MSAHPILTTHRLTLRAPVMGDCARIARFANDWGVASMVAGMPYPYGLAEAEDFIGWAGQKIDRGDRVFAMDLAGEGVIGMIGLHCHDDGVPELGYWLGRPYWGAGFATEAGSTVVAWAHGPWSKPWITAGHFEDNPASGRVLDKLGFLYTGDRPLMGCRARQAMVRTRNMVRLS